MKKIFDEVVWYALGRKGNVHKRKHGKVKENENVTNVQNLLSILDEDIVEFNERFKQLTERKC